MPDQDPSNAWSQLITSVQQAWPISRWRDVGVVVGCSGGADSVCLLRALHELRARLPTESTDSGSPKTGFLVAAHFNHATRGQESDLDASFVSQVADDLGIQVIQESGDGNTTDEASLRDQRYEFLHRAAQRCGARYIALAHSLDDNVETVLHHLMRGTGPSGLTGIASHRPMGADKMSKDFVVSRPLLSVRRDLIRDSLRSINQNWREDASNNDTKYRRNWIRAELIPLMQTQYPNLIDAVGRAIESQRGWRDTIDSLASTWIQDHVINDTPLTIRRTVGQRESVIIHALQTLWKEQLWSATQMNQTSWQRIAKTLQKQEIERYSLPGDIDVVAGDRQVIVSPCSRSIGKSKKSQDV